MRNFFRWLIYNVFYQSPYCAKCGACGDDIGCGCDVNCKGGLFCIHPHLTKHALDGATRCPECGEGVVGYLGRCEICGYNPPRQ